jgi:hypothetical protein
VRPSNESGGVLIWLSHFDPISSLFKGSNRNLALPTEHGGWGLVLEPLLVGMIVAPSKAGAGLALAMVSLFLARHPLKIALRDIWRGTHYPRTKLAIRIAGLYCAAAVTGLLLAFTLTVHAFWHPLLIATPLALVQLYYDARLRSRNLAAEVAGTLAAAAGAPVIAAAAGWHFEDWLPLLILVASRVLTAMLYVRARLRLERGDHPGTGWVIAIHLLTAIAATGMALQKRVPWLAMVVMILLLARAVIGLSKTRRPARPRDIGMAEFAYGAAFVACVSVGYLFPL